MKLLSKYNKINLLAISVIFALASVAYFFLLRFVIVDQLDENLDIEQKVIETYVAKYKKLPEIIPVEDQAIKFLAAKTFQSRKLQTIEGYDSVEKDHTDFRELLFSINPDGRKWYRASVAKSMEGTEALIKSIILITVCTILLILLTSFLINRLVLNRLWQPFHNTLTLLKDFKVGSKQSFVLQSSNIEEFSLMNTVLQQSITRADHDYQILKEFTENASHEMQTPLAIIRSKLDLLIQEESLSVIHGESIQALYKAIDKLSRLNKALLLLAKIENNQFNVISRIDLVQKLKDKLLQFNEIILENKITVIKHLHPNNILMDVDLAEILLNNLISNAIKHNTEGGKIYIFIESGSRLSIRNTSSLPALDTDKLFTRFYKVGENKEHTGLGLSILRKICDVSGCSIEYSFADGDHVFTVQW
ncbi:MAG TPA: HAMP domain-containing sensor histidine kinase [Flavitalea sp.]|nr:HAMP domain-containing sensor histidine kinase [Flavitalea sp.]